MNTTIQDIGEAIVEVIKDAFRDESGINMLPGMIHSNEQYRRLADYVIENGLFRNTKHGSHTDNVIFEIAKLTGLLEQARQEIRDLAADKDQSSAVIDDLSIAYDKLEKRAELAEARLENTVAAEALLLKNSKEQAKVIRSLRNQLNRVRMAAGVRPPRRKRI